MRRLVFAVIAAGTLLIVPGGGAGSLNGLDGFVPETQCSGANCQITVRNTGQRALEWIGFEIHVPAETTALTASHGGSCSFQHEIGVCFFRTAGGQANFAVGQTRTLSLQTNPALAVGTEVSVCGGGDINSLTCVPAPVKAPAPDLALEIQGPTSALVGAKLEYTVLVTNIGMARSGPAQITIKTADRTAADRETLWRSFHYSGGGSMSLNIHPLEPGGSASIEFSTWVEVILSSPAREREIGVILAATGSTGDRTLVAELVVPDSPVGANKDEHVTTFGTGSAPRNDTDANCPSGTARAPGERACTGPARRVRAFTGSASGNVRGVEIGVARLTRGTRSLSSTAALRCSWLVSRAARFRPGVGSHGGCRRPAFLEAKGAKRWRFPLTGGLRKGCYLLFSRALSSQGVPERRFSAKDRNYRAFCLR